jgi:hypothetical protein
MIVARSSGFTLRASVRNRLVVSEVSPALPRFSRVVIDMSASGPSSSKLITHCRPGTRERISLIFSPCSRFETKTPTAPESLRMYAICSAGRVGYTGTSANPAVRHAKSAIAHSGLFSERMATLSPRLAPSPAIPRAA